VSRIVLATWGSLGDLHPFVALGLGLRDRGHDLVLATTEEYRSGIEALGFKFDRIRPDLPSDPDLLERAMDPKLGPKLVLKQIVLDNIRDTYEDLMAIAQDADFLIAHELIYAAPCVAAVLKLRWATCALSPASFFSAYEPLVTSVYPFLASIHRFGPKVNRGVVEFARLV
jgi:rhamnosyltransferase subunit B